MPRNTSYLFKRPNSKNWYVRIQYPPWLAKIEGRKKLEKSLGTTDIDEASIAAADYITYLKRALFMRKQIARVHTLAQKGPKRFQPGMMHVLPSGGYVAATDDQLTYYDSSGKELRKEDNTETVQIPISPTQQEARAIAPYLPKRVNPDDEIIERWIKHRNIGKHLASEARNAWIDFKTLTNDKPLSKSSRKDGIDLANLFLSRNNNSSTAEKKIGHLRAAVNLHMLDGSLPSNPFHKVTPHRNDRLKRSPLSTNDMKEVARNLELLSNSDQLLWKLLACTGMRLDEAFQINEEYIEDGVRYVKIGTKTTSSERRVPLPTLLLSDLPHRIEGPIFSGQSSVAGKRLMYFLRKLQISHDRLRGTGDRRKVVHSLRHRAKDRLRAERCPLDVQYEILGHEKSTVAAGYGHGYPVIAILEYVDKIGW
ncbi:tyrosine-type recombinase/integrase [Methylobacterium sp. WL122]|nr:tyrosine-type recombinase/integrase [Methylobacterium sp. WL122]